MTMAQRVAALNKAFSTGNHQTEEKKEAPVTVAKVKTDAASTNSEGVAPEQMTMA